MLTLRITFDHCTDPAMALAGVRFRGNSAGLRLRGDVLHIPADHDHSFRFGRHLSCDVILPESAVPFVARKHLQIEVTSHIWYLRDLGTKNGTWLNGVRLGGPPAASPSLVSRTPSGRQKLRAGDLIRLAGMTLTVLGLPAVRPVPRRPTVGGLASAGQPASGEFATGASVPRLPPAVVFNSAAPPSSPPVLEGFKFAGTLGGKPASGLTYLYERTGGNGAMGEKWVVKYLAGSSPFDTESLRHLIGRFYGVENAALNHPRAFGLAPEAGPARLALCFPCLEGSNLARPGLLDLAAIHAVMIGALGTLAVLHGQGLAHGHVGAANIFLDETGGIAITDAGLNSIRSLVGAELTGPPPSASNDLMALGHLCLTLLGEPANEPRRPGAAPMRDRKQRWPGLPLHELACHLRRNPPSTAREALEALEAMPRPKVSRLLTAPQWKSPPKVIE